MYQLNQTVYAPDTIITDSLAILRGNRGTITEIFENGDLQVEWDGSGMLSRISADDIQGEPVATEENYQDVVDETAKYYSDEMEALRETHQHEIAALRTEMEASTTQFGRKVNNLLKKAEALQGQLEQERQWNADMREKLEAAQTMLRDHISVKDTDEYPAIEIVKDIPSGLYHIPNTQHKKPVVDTYVIQDETGEFVKGFYGFNLSPYPDEVWIKFYPESDCVPVNEPVTITGTIGTAEEKVA